MFKNEIESFKRKVAKETKAFFNLAPEQLGEEILKMRTEYMEFCDLDGDSILDDLSPEYKEILVKYKTLLYFYKIWGGLLDLEDFLKNGGF